MIHVGLVLVSVFVSRSISRG